MFSIGRLRVYRVFHDIPDSIERKMKRFHQKWFKEGVALIPWSVGEEIGATLRMKCGEESFAISWGCANETAFRVYDGDVAGEITAAVNGEKENEKMARAREEIWRLAAEGSRACWSMEEVVNDVIKRIKLAGLAMRMMK